ncbi:MAG: hypothetical protein ACI8RZ_002509 [Myxococcota bacterium]|jgi:hypothetical protein
MTARYTGESDEAEWRELDDTYEWDDTDCDVILAGEVTGDGRVDLVLGRHAQLAGAPRPPVRRQPGS